MRTGVRTLRRTGFGACFPKCSMPAAGLFEPELPEKAARNPAEKSCFTAGHGTTTHIAAPNALGKAFFSHFWAEKEVVRSTGLPRVCGPLRSLPGL